MSIATRIESISNHLENAYNSLENIGVDLTGINKNISNLSTQIESVYTDLPKTTETDTDIILNNTKKGKIELNLKGNVNQFTTTGKNKLKYPYTEENIERDGITYTMYNDGSIKINGTATATSYIDLYRNLTENLLEKNQAYTFSITPNSNSLNLTFLERYNEMCIKKMFFLPYLILL